MKKFSTRIVKIEQNDRELLICFEDTIFFPSGGGQPTDYGEIVAIDCDGVEQSFQVSNVVRKGSEAIHHVEVDREIALNIGDEITQIVDWNRRHDHMQQHSGQHLISALFEQVYGYNTKSWWLGLESSYIEIDGKDITQSDMKDIESECNHFIAEGRPVKVEMFDSVDGAVEGVNRASRGLPIDLGGPIRVITIEGVDSNMCCGTHVSNLAQLQAVKLMNFEKSKGKILVHFLVGDRLIKKLESTFQREIQFNVLLNGGADYHVELLKKLQLSHKSAQKTIQKLSKEIAVKVAEEINANPSRSYYSIHRNDGVDIDFSNTFLRTVKVGKFFFITISDGIDSKSGSLIIRGNSEDVAALSPEICKLLNGKGNGKGDRYLGKVDQLNKIKDCEDLIKKYFENK